MTTETTESKSLTYEQFRELYGKVKVYFESYYEYLFWFRSKNDLSEINVAIAAGGDSEDIYRASRAIIDAGKPYILARDDVGKDDIASLEYALSAKDNTYYMVAYRVVEGKSEIIHEYERKL